MEGGFQLAVTGRIKEGSKGGGKGGKGGRGMEGVLPPIHPGGVREGR